MIEAVNRTVESELRKGGGIKKGQGKKGKKKKIGSQKQKKRKEIFRAAKTRVYFESKRR